MSNDEIWDGEVSFINLEDDGTAFLIGADGIQLSAEAQADLARRMLAYTEKWGDYAIESMRECQRAELRAEAARRNCEPRRVERKSLYLMSTPSGYKIGISKDPNRRLHEILRHQPNAELVAVSKPVKTRRAMEIEKQFHDALSPRQIVGEWFRLSEEEANKVHALITEAVDE